jgi:hypothetical protein
LLWADSASSGTFGGDKSFQAASTKAQILDKLGKKEEAAAVMKKALPNASMFEMHGYGRSLITQKKPKEALDSLK